jgi:hypothetical protein
MSLSRLFGADVKEVLVSYDSGEAGKPLLTPTLPRD